MARFLRRWEFAAVTKFRQQQVEVLISSWDSRPETALLPEALRGWEVHKMTAAPLILLVEDDPDVRSVLEAFLTQCGYRLSTANDCHLGAEILRDTRPDLLVSDVMLPDGTGKALAELDRAMNIPVLLNER